MKFSHVVVSALGLGSAVNAAVIPEDAKSLAIRTEPDVIIPDSGNTLEKRKGGGGREVKSS